MHINSYLSGYVSEAPKGASQTANPYGNLGIDEDFLYPCGDRGTFEHEKELDNLPEEGCFRIRDLRHLCRSGVGITVGDVSDHTDFRDEIDPNEHVIHVGSHPECAIDEAFLGNVDPAVYRLLRWKTKRLGKIAVTPNGRPLKKGFYPLFVKIEELVAVGISLQ